MRPIALTLTLLAGLFQLACSSGTEERTPPANSRVSDDNVFSPQVRALEKAERVEQMMLDAHKRRSQQIDARSR